MNRSAQPRRFPTLEQVRELPLQLEHRIPPEWEDRNGHVNVQFYLALFEMGGWRMLEDVGIYDAWFSRNAYSIFDLEHHLHYLAEIGVGELVRTYNRVVGKSDKRFHGLYLIVNESRGRLAGTLEYISTGVDMRVRRTAAMPAELSAALDRLYREHRTLTWQPPLCGFMAP